ncbi:Oxygen regulatory protein NreC [Amycolatopsis sp. CA-230715]|nr:Oxygen regulatory protein NreC [Amycolatopsis sp. CA-230715]
MLRVVVVDDDASIRSGLERALTAAGDIEVVATATGAKAIDVVALHRPDVVLLDQSGFTVLRELRREAPRTKVAMLTASGGDAVATALRAGAAGVVLTDTAPEQLAQLVRTVAAGGVVLPPRSVRGRRVW